MIDFDRDSGWKTLDHSSSESNGSFAHGFVKEQLRNGISEYGYEYLHDDPLRDMAEEMADQWNYLIWAMKQRDAVLWYAIQAIENLTAPSIDLDEGLDNVTKIVNILVRGENG